MLIRFLPLLVCREMKLHKPAYCGHHLKLNVNYNMKVMKKIFEITIAFCLFLIASNGLSAQDDTTLSPYFQVHSASGTVERFPLESTTVNANITGVVADVIVNQTYRNDGSEAIEATYVFPASTRAAVYGMQMVIGTRVITAKIKEKEAARMAYNQAKSEGKRASLLEQERPNVFQMNVANIMPGETVEVSLQYTEMLVPEGGKYEFVFPEVVGPRYAGVQKVKTGTPYLKNGSKSPFPIKIYTRIDAGMPIQDITCKSHKVDVKYPSTTTAKIRLDATAEEKSNKDFILEYRLAGNKIQSGLMLYEGEEENFFTLMVQPPKTIKTGEIPPREYIFVMDVSGSMNGFPLSVSKKLMRNLIANLKPTDKFNVLLFAGASAVLAEESLHATPENLRDAMYVIDKQEGDGGTELLPALEKALALPRCESNLSRSIVVVTDGYINVEREAFDLIRNNLNQSNLFAFGIGSGVNRHLIEGMANVGMGTPFIVTSPDGADAKAELFREYIEKPVLTGITVDYNGFDAYDVEPKSVADVLADRPILIYGKYKGNAKGNIRVKGYTGNEHPYYANFKVGDVLPDSRNIALKYLWAREKIRLMDDYRILDGDEEIKDAVTRIGLRYNLLTDYTSFIAIDEDELASNGNPKRVNQPLPLPEGVSNSAVGFDLAIQGVVRKPKAPVSPKKSVLSDEYMNVLKAFLKLEMEKMKGCLKEELEFRENTVLELELDKDGTILSILIKDSGLDETIILCMQDKLKGKRLPGFALQQETTIAIPVKMLK